MSRIRTKCIPTRVTLQRKGGGTVTFPSVRVVRANLERAAVEVRPLLGRLRKHVRGCPACAARIARASSAIGKVVACASLLLLLCAISVGAQSAIGVSRDVPRGGAAGSEAGMSQLGHGRLATSLDTNRRAAGGAGCESDASPTCRITSPTLPPARWEYVAWAGLAGASHFAVQRDVSSTQRALRLGFEERTRFARPFVDSPRKHAAAAHAATAGVNALSLWMLRSKRQPWRAMWWIPQLALATVPHVFANRNDRLRRAGCAAQGAGCR